MKKNYLLLLLFFSLLIGCTKKDKEETPKSLETVKLSVIKIEKSKVVDFYETSGTVISKNPVKLISKVMGTVAKVNFEEGSEVVKGQLLMEIDAPDILANYERANSAVLEAEKALAIAKNNAKFAENTFERYRRLYEEKAISLQEYENIETKRNYAVEEVRRTEMVLEQAKAERERAKAMLSYTKIFAPFSGVVTEKLANLGVNVMPGMPLLTIEANRDLQLVVNVDEKMLPFVKKGQSLLVTFDAIKKDVKAIISEIVPSIDPVNRTFKLKLNLPNDNAIKLGLYGVVKMPLGEKETIFIPQSAVLMKGQLSYVYVLDKDNVASLRLVRTGEVKNGNVEILSGLTVGEKIVKEAQLAKNGVKVKEE